MLRLVRSHRLDRLADALADVLRTPAGGPLDPEWVVASARPTERWLTAHLAQRLGICAHVRVLSPSSLVEELVGAALGLGTDAARAWRPEPLAWHVLAALPGLLDRPAFAPVRGYLAGSAADAGAAADLGSARAVGFARRVGECFARYGLVMPDEVAAWEREGDGAAGDGDPDEAWQRALWRALRADGACGEPLPALAARAFAALGRDGAPPAIPRRVAWLAQPGLAPLHARAAAALARAGVEVVALCPTPSARAWWREGEASADAPPLLRSLGRLAGDTARLLDEACAAAGVAPERVDLFDDAPSASALARLRRDLVDGVRRGTAAAPRLPLDAGDDSVRVHACHGPMRQAEVLRDELLRLFAADETLAPRDVLVLTPDVAAVAPLVESAFGATAGGAAIPVRVLDRPARRGNPAADAVLRVLALAAGRVDAVAALDLLALPCVARRFGLGAGDEETLRRWVRESGVRWGLDGDDRAEAHGLPADEEHTWRFGLERLLLGWGLPGEGRALFGGVLPYDEVEGGDAELLGRFAEACARLFDAVRAARGARPMGEWRRVLCAAADALVDDAPALAVPRRELRAALDALAGEAAAFDAPVSLGAVRLLLEARFAEPAAGGGAAGAVTLAALRPGRVTPARVVALLGVDEQLFPRPRASAGFDLLARAPRPGATDAPAEDRARVLEALLAAGERLVVVYAGRTADTNRPVAPAVPVAELLDAVDATFARADARLDAAGRLEPARTLVEEAHPLQPFSPRAFDGAAPRSHDAVHLAGARRLGGPRAAPPPFLARPLPPPDDDGGARAVAVDDLAAWLAEPARAFVQRRLGVWYDAPEALDVADPLELDALGEWSLRRDVMERLLAGEEPARAAELLRAAGRLPHGPLGRLAFEAAHAQARAVARPAALLRRARVRDAARVDAAAGGVRLVGTLGALWRGGPAEWGPGLRDVHAGHARPRHLVRLWVRHLALHLADGIDAPPTSACVARADRQGHNAFAFGPVDDAAARLADLLALYEAGARAPLPYAADTSHAYAAAWCGARADDDAHRAGLEAARKAWAPAFGAPGDGGDPYARRLFGDDGPLAHDDFPAVARRVWAPLLAGLQARVE